MRFAFFCGLVAALLCLTQNANAQYARKGADLVSEEANRVSGNVSLNVGATPNGMGIVLNF